MRRLPVTAISQPTLTVAAPLCGNPARASYLTQPLPYNQAKHGVHTTQPLIPHTSCCPQPSPTNSHYIWQDNAHLYQSTLTSQSISAISITPQTRKTLDDKMSPRANMFYFVFILLDYFSIVQIDTRFQSGSSNTSPTP